MRQLTFEPFVIISATKENYDNDTNVKQSMKLKERLRDLGYKSKVVYGSYQGNTETSFYVPGMSDEVALELATEFNQDCVLVVDQFRWASLVWHHRIERIGKFEESEDGVDFTIIDGVRFCCVA